MSGEHDLSRDEQELLQQWAVGELDAADPRLQAACERPAFRRVYEQTLQAREALDLASQELQEILASAEAEEDAPGADEARLALERLRRGGRRRGPGWGGLLVAAAVTGVLGLTASRIWSPPARATADLEPGVRALSGIEDEIQLVSPAGGRGEVLGEFEFLAPEGMEITVHLELRRRTDVGWEDLPEPEPLFLGERRRFVLEEELNLDGPVDWVRWNATGMQDDLEFRSGSRVWERSSP